MGGRAKARKVARALAYPLRRLLDPRFADVRVRMAGLDEAVRAEGASVRAAVAGLHDGMATAHAAATAQVLDGLDAAVARHAESNGEALRFVGSQLRDLLDEVRMLEKLHAADNDGSYLDIAKAFAVRALAGVPSGAKALAIGGGDRFVGTLLAAFGYEVVAIGAGAQAPAPEHPGVERLDGEPSDLRGRTFDAVVSLTTVDPDEIRPLLPRGGVAVLLQPPGPGSAWAGWDVFDALHLREVLPGTWVRTTSPERATASLVAAMAT